MTRADTPLVPSFQRKIFSNSERTRNPNRIPNQTPPAKFFLRDSSVVGPRTLSVLFCRIFIYLTHLFVVFYCTFYFLRIHFATLGPLHLLCFRSFSLPIQIPFSSLSRPNFLIRSSFVTTLSVIFVMT